MTVQQRSAAAPKTAFGIAMPIDPASVFNRMGPFPGVTGVEEQTGEWNAVGRSRRIRLTDGTAATERLVDVAPSTSFAYESTGFTNLLGHLVDGVRAEWTFSPDGRATMIRWTYEFLPLPGRRMLVAGALAPGWRLYMQRGLNAVVRRIERAR